MVSPPLNHFPSHPIHFRPRYPKSTGDAFNKKPPPWPQQFLSGRCFHCTRRGQYAFTYRNPIACYNCGGLGHLRFYCKSSMRSNQGVFNHLGTELRETLLDLRRILLESRGSILKEASFAISLELINSTEVRGCDKTQEGRDFDDSLTVQHLDRLGVVKQCDVLFDDPDVSSCILGEVKAIVLGSVYVLSDSPTASLMYDEGIEVYVLSEIRGVAPYFRDLLDQTSTRAFEVIFNCDGLEDSALLVQVHVEGQVDDHVEDIFEDTNYASLSDLPRSSKVARKVAKLKLMEQHLVSLVNISIIDILAPNRDNDSSKGDIALYIKSCKFFLHYFLTAHRMFSASFPPIGSWRAQLYSKHSNFNYSSPDSVAMDRCIFVKDNVFSRESFGVKCKKKLAFSDKLRRSPRISRKH